MIDQPRHAIGRFKDCGVRVTRKNVIRIHPTRGNLRANKLRCFLPTKRTKITPHRQSLTERFQLRFREALLERRRPGQHQPNSWLPAAHQIREHSQLIQ